MNYSIFVKKSVRNLIPLFFFFFKYIIYWNKYIVFNHSSVFNSLGARKYFSPTEKKGEFVNSLQTYKRGKYAVVDIWIIAIR